MHVSVGGDDVILHLSADQDVWVGGKGAQKPGLKDPWDGGNNQQPTTNNRQPTRRLRRRRLQRRSSACSAYAVGGLELERIYTQPGRIHSLAVYTQLGQI